MGKVIRLFLITFLLTPATGEADTLTKEISGACDGGEASVRVSVTLIPTGGDFELGMGTANVTITLRNISPVIPLGSQIIGNPVLTGFLFNLPPGADAVMIDARILAGSKFISTGTKIRGVKVDPQCVTLPVDVPQPSWYKLEGRKATGEFGIFTYGVGTSEGVKAGLVNTDIYDGCIALGAVLSPAMIAGRLSFTVALSQLDQSLDSAGDFLRHCSIAPGDQQPSAFSARFQATGINGQGSCKIGEEGLCGTVNTEDHTWGAIKAMYR